MNAAGGGAAAPAGEGVRDPDSIARANLLAARALLAGLVAGGVRHLCLSPGSRSSPIALAARLESRLAISVQVDERSAGFLALGLAKSTRAPVALLCTSGTAAANYLPAVAEAFLAGVPLVALTADRPPELRGTGAPQTIDQVRLYGSHVRHVRDLACPGDPGASPEEMAAAGLEACRIATAGARAPVHLNAPYREPLLPRPDAMDACEGEWAALAARVAPSLQAAAPATHALPPLPVLASLLARLEKARRPLIVAGPEAVRAADAWTLLALARAAGVRAECEVWQEMPHRWQGLPVGPESRRAIEHCADFVRECCP